MNELRFIAQLFDFLEKVPADRVRALAGVALILLLSPLDLSLMAAEPAAGKQKDVEYWVEPMKKVHGQFTGRKGTFAQFGDSITVTMAFWSPLAGEPKNMSPETAQAHARVKSYMNPDCWNKWKGPEFGNNGSMTIRWARNNADKWLKKLNPEVVVIMFGSKDVGQMEEKEYERRTREVVQRCLKNGTVVLLTTAPPRSGLVPKTRAFAGVIGRIAQEEKVPRSEEDTSELQSH